jgi:Na+/H+ antiporter NhaD/arsenite permease-like protein
MDAVVLVAFLFVYIGMVLGNIPGFSLDRTGIALLGAIALLAGRSITTEDAWVAVDVPTLGLLFGLMVISAQFRLAGFYSQVTRRLASVNASPEKFLALIILVVALLSAILANDIVCLAVTPVLVEGCIRRGLNPVPFLLALACASNVGSAATLIGNPQNMLIGQKLGLSFSLYLFEAFIPVLLGLCAVWFVVRQRYRNGWYRDLPSTRVDAPPYDSLQAGKGVVVISLLVIAFLMNSWPRDVLALTAAGILLLSKKMASRTVLGLVDWQLLILFGALFVLNHALFSSGITTRMIGHLSASGIDLQAPAWLFAATALLSNLVSNVPAIMLLIPVASHPSAGTILALVSTFAGNLLIVGSIANIIVIDQAERVRPELRITWLEHARVGVPVTLITLFIAGGWLWVRG